MKKSRILSIRKNKRVLDLFAQIQDYQRSAANRTEITAAAIAVALKRRVDWKEMEGADFSLPADSGRFEGRPEFIQLRVWEEDYEEIADQIREDLNLLKSSRAPTAPFVLRLLLTNYLMTIKGEETESGSVQVREEAGGRFETLGIEEKLNVLYQELMEIKKMMKSGDGRSASIYQ